MSAKGAGEVTPEHGAPPVAEAAGHLQTAALEVIAAVRALLDAAEAVVKDPTSAAAAASTLADKARRRSPHTDEADGNDDGKVQHIPVS